MANQAFDVGQILEEIERAFDGVARDEGITLHETVEIDRCSGERQLAKARRLDTDKRWKDVPETDIERFPSALCFMDATGFRYYIPAYMSWTLRSHRTSDSETTDNTISAFESDPLHRDKRYSLLNDSQRRAVCRFLKYFAGKEDDLDRAYWAGIALRMGWGDYYKETNAVGELND